MANPLDQNSTILQQFKTLSKYSNEQCLKQILKMTKMKDLFESKISRIESKQCSSENLYFFLIRNPFRDILLSFRRHRTINALNSHKLWNYVSLMKNQFRFESKFSERFDHNLRNGFSYSSIAFKAKLMVFMAWRSMGSSVLATEALVSLLVSHSVTQSSDLQTLLSSAFSLISFLYFFYFAIK